MSTILAERLWCILDALVESEQPIETMCLEYKTFSSTTEPENILMDLFVLYQAEFISLCIVESDAQLASPRSIVPLSWSEIPLNGIRLKLTSLGVCEWEDPKYKIYWCQGEEGVEISTRRSGILELVMGVLAFCLMAVALWGSIDGSWSYDQDYRVSLAPDLMPIRAILSASGVSPAVLHRLELAALPNIWASRAVESLVEADELLEPLSDNAQITLVRGRLKSLICKTNPYCLYEKSTSVRLSRRAGDAKGD